MSKFVKVMLTIVLLSGCHATSREGEPRIGAPTSLKIVKFNSARAQALVSVDTGDRGWMETPTRGRQLKDTVTGIEFVLLDVAVPPVQPSSLPGAWNVPCVENEPEMPSNGIPLHGLITIRPPPCPPRWLCVSRNTITWRECTRLFEGSSTPKWFASRGSRDGDDDPVHNMNWEDASAIALKAGFRLPTVWEWQAVFRHAWPNGAPQPMENDVFPNGLMGAFGLRGFNGPADEWALDPVKFGDPPELRGHATVGLWGFWGGIADCIGGEHNRLADGDTNLGLGFRLVLDP